MVVVGYGGGGRVVRGGEILCFERGRERVERIE